MIKPANDIMMIINYNNTKVDYEITEKRVGMTLAEKVMKQGGIEM